MATTTAGSSEMAIVRRNILDDEATLKKFCDGINLLNADFSAGVTTHKLGFTGLDLPVSAYDQFVIWHYVAMNILTPNDETNTTSRNSAHRGSVFLPWHRFMLLLFEAHLQRVLEDASFGLPYWDWAKDGDSPSAQQPQLNLWKATGIGGSGSPVTDGPFGFDPAHPDRGFRVRFFEDVISGELSIPLSGGRGLVRSLRGNPARPIALPTTQQVSALFDDQHVDYDVENWDVTSSTGLRNPLEGWVPRESAPNLHNRVHVWIGGDMGPGTSPNDPAFYLNHCNVDRIWEAWMVKNGRVYMPEDTTPGAPVGHRLNDEIISLVTTLTTKPNEMLDVSDRYVYDALPV